MKNKFLPILLCSFLAGCSLDENGLVGPKGDPGPQGLPGIQGPKGENGQQGPSVGESLIPDPTNGSRIRIERQISGWAGEDGSEAYNNIVTVSFYDSWRQEYCTWQKAEDGVTRCLPYTEISYINAFADQNCSEPAVVLYDYDFSPCIQNYERKYSKWKADYNSCAESALYLIGQELTKIYYKQSDVICTEFPTPQNYKMFKLGEHIIPTKFEAGQSITKKF